MLPPKQPLMQNAFLLSNLAFYIDSNTWYGSGDPFVLSNGLGRAPSLGEGWWRYDAKSDASISESGGALRLRKDFISRFFHEGLLSILRLRTSCSGLSTPLRSLHELGFRFGDLWSSSMAWVVEGPVPLPSSLVLTSSVLSPFSRLLAINAFVGGKGLCAYAILIGLLTLLPRMQTTQVSVYGK